QLDAREKAAAMAAFNKARGNGKGPVTGGAGGLGGGVAGGFGGEAGEGAKARSREAMIKRFDKNGDGKLSEDEKAEAQKELKAKRGAGKGERRPAGGKMAEILKKFDTDGDGKLSDEEKAAAKGEFAEKRKEKGKKPE